MAGYRNVQNFPSHSQGIKESLHVLLHAYHPLRTILASSDSLEQVGLLTSRLVISNHHNSHGCQWDLPKHLAYSRLSTTLAMLIIKGLHLGCLRSRCKTLSSYNQIKEISSDKGIFPFCNFPLLMMSREQIRLFICLNAYDETKGEDWAQE